MNRTLTRTIVVPLFAHACDPYKSYSPNPGYILYKPESYPGLTYLMTCLPILLDRTRTRRSHSFGAIAVYLSIQPLQRSRAHGHHDGTESEESDATVPGKHLENGVWVPTSELATDLRLFLPTVSGIK